MTTIPPIGRSNPHHKSLAPAAVGPFGTPQPPAIELDGDAEFRLGTDPLIPHRGEIASLPPPSPVVPPAPPVEPRKPSWPERHYFGLWGSLSFVLGAAGMLLAIKGSNGWIVVKMGWPFMAWLLVWSYRHPEEAGVLAVGLATFNHESNKRHAQKMAALNGRLNTSYVPPRGKLAAPSQWPPPAPTPPTRKKGLGDMPGTF